MAIFKGTIGADTFVATGQADNFYVNNVNDVIIGGNSQDTVYSLLSSYELASGLGNLVLSTGAISGTGNAGNNAIQGNLRDNILDGGMGQDLLMGGGGRDTFVFSHSGDLHADSIIDYVPGVDKIAVRGSAFGLASGTPHDYVLNGQATSMNPTFIRMGSAGTAQSIYFDADGVGAGKAQLICTIQTFAGMTNINDFSII